MNHLKILLTICMHIHIIATQLVTPVRINMDINYCFNLAMRKSARIITQFYEERLAVVGVKSGQFSLLRAVHYLKKTTNKELQTILVIDQTTLSRNLKPLIRDGFLTVSPDEGDQRRKIIHLSSKGKKLYLKALPIWQKLQQDLVKKMGIKESEEIQRISKSLTNKLIQN